MCYIRACFRGAAESLFDYLSGGFPPKPGDSSAAGSSMVEAGAARDGRIRVNISLGTMKRLTYAGLLIGLTVLAGLIAWRGIGEVGAILLSSGWGLLVLPIVWAPMLLLTAVAWRMLFEPDAAPQFHWLLAATWIGRAVSAPVSVVCASGTSASVSMKRLPR